MDTDALHSALVAISIVSQKLHSARERLPTPATEMEELLRAAEADLKVARGTIARELGFELCPKCWPPELLVPDNDGRTKCPACGHIARHASPSDEPTVARAQLHIRRDTTDAAQQPSSIVC